MSCTRQLTAPTLSVIIAIVHSAELLQYDSQQLALSILKHLLEFMNVTPTLEI